MAEVTLCPDQPKVLVRAAADGAVAGALATPLGRATRTGDGGLVVRTAPDAWLLLGGAAPGMEGDEFASAFDVTHGYAVVRLTGRGAAEVLSRTCAIEPPGPGRALRSLVAGVAATMVRDDQAGGVPSYLVACDRSYGEYLVDVFTDAASY